MDNFLPTCVTQNTVLLIHCILRPHAFNGHIFYHVCSFIHSSSPSLNGHISFTIIFQYNLKRPYKQVALYSSDRNWYSILGGPFVRSLSFLKLSEFYLLTMKYHAFSCNTCLSVTKLIIKFGWSPLNDNFCQIIQKKVQTVSGTDRAQSEIWMNCLCVESFIARAVAGNQTL